ncbi:MAG: ABC transporter permease subunit [Candidatus Hydrothermales bacterium]
MKALLKKEFLDVLRDKRTIINMIIIPVFGVPFLMVFMGGIMTKSIKELGKMKYKVGIYEKVEFKEIRDIMSDLNFDILETNDPHSLLIKKEIDVGIVIDKKEDKFFIEIIYLIKEKTSEFARIRLKKILDSFKEKLFNERLEERGIRLSELIPFVLEEKGIESGKKFFGYFLGTVFGFITVILMMTSAMYPAIDLVTGEKERRTLEILLSSPAGINKVIISKILVVTVVSFITAILTIISLSITLLKGGILIEESISQVHIFKAISIKEIFLIFSVIIPFAFLISGIEIAIASYARSYKEAQSLLTPLTFAVIIPALYSFLPSINFSPYHFLIPVLNIAITIKKVLQGEFVLIEYFITLISNIFYMLFAFIYSVRTFKKEKVIFRV